MITRCLPLSIGALIGAAVALGPAKVEGQCLRLTSADTTPMASVFVAELLERHPYTESVGGIGPSPVEWPMVELSLRVLYGWNERPRILPHDPDSDTLSIRIRPEEDPGLPIGTQIVAFMTRVYMEEVILNPPQPPTPPRRVGPGMLVPAARGLCALDGARAELRTLGSPHWRRGGP